MSTELDLPNLTTILSGYSFFDDVTCLPLSKVFYEGKVAVYVKYCGRELLCYVVESSVLTGSVDKDNLNQSLIFKETPCKKIVIDGGVEYNGLFTVASVGSQLRSYIRTLFLTSTSYSFQGMGISWKANPITEGAFYKVIPIEDLERFKTVLELKK